MSDNSASIVSKVWNYAHVLKDAGVGYESDQGFLLNANLENLCAQGAERGKLREACVEECRIIGRDGYGFVMEAEGEVFAPEGQTVEDGVTGDFRLRMTTENSESAKNLGNHPTE